MQINKINHKNYYIYTILVFIFIPLNFIPQLMDAVSIIYAYEIKDISQINLFYISAGRYFHLIFIYLIDGLSKYTFIPAEFFLDNFLVLFLILFCFEVRLYTKLLFNLEDKWCNFAALFTAIFPIWHILVDFDIGQYLISIYLLLFGFRNFIKKNKIKSFLSLIFIFISFNVESNLSFVIGLSIIFLILKKNNSLYNISSYKFLTISLTVLLYYFLRVNYFPPTGMYEGLNMVSLGDSIKNIFSFGSLNNIINYSTFLTVHLWVPFFFITHLILVNRKNLKNYGANIKNINFIISFKNYFLLLMLAGFAIFPYLIVNKSSSLFYASDYYQRHAMLLAPIFGMFFSNMFSDLSRFNLFTKKVSISFYLISFICINLIFLNFGNYRKFEANQFRKNLVAELKNYGNIPKGDVLLIIKDISKIVAEFRSIELNYLFYKAYGEAAWWVTPFFPNIVTNPPQPPPLYLSNEKYRNIFIINNYKNECKTYITLGNTLTLSQRIKSFYIINYKQYYKIIDVKKDC